MRKEMKLFIDKLELMPFGTNCYIVGDETTNDAMVIDPGIDGPSIVAKINQLGAKVTLIVLTHGHPDHIGALNDVKEATGAEVAIHPEDASYIEGGGGGGFGFSRQKPVKPDILLNEGDTFKIGSLEFKVIHTPGHTQGGICLYNEENNVIFTGDTLFRLSIGRYDMPGGDGRQLLNNIAAKLMTLPEETIALPGHGPGTTIGDEKQGNPFLNM